jgi:hypothetical protein
MMGERLAQHMFPRACSITFLSLEAFVPFATMMQDGEFTRNHGNKFIPEGRMRTPTGRTAPGHMFGRLED